MAAGPGGPGSGAYPSSVGGLQYSAHHGGPYTTPPPPQPQQHPSEAMLQKIESTISDILKTSQASLGQPQQHQGPAPTLPRLQSHPTFTPLSAPVAMYSSAALPASAQPTRVTSPSSGGSRVGVATPAAAPAAPASGASVTTPSNALPNVRSRTTSTPVVSCPDPALESAPSNTWTSVAVVAGTPAALAPHASSVASSSRADASVSKSPLSAPPHINDRSVPSSHRANPATPKRPPVANGGATRPAINPEVFATADGAGGGMAAADNSHMMMTVPAVMPVGDHAGFADLAGDADATNDGVESHVMSGLSPESHTAAAYATDDQRTVVSSRMPSVRGRLTGAPGRAGRHQPPASYVGSTARSYTPDSRLINEAFPDDTPSATQGDVRTTSPAEESTAHPNASEAAGTAPADAGDGEGVDEGEGVSGGEEGVPRGSRGDMFTSPSPSPSRPLGGSVNVVSGGKPRTSPFRPQASPQTRRPMPPTRQRQPPTPAAGGVGDYMDTTYPQAFASPTHFHPPQLGAAGGATPGGGYRSLSPLPGQVPGGVPAAHPAVVTNPHALGHALPALDDIWGTTAPRSPSHHGAPLAVKMFHVGGAADGTQVVPLTPTRRPPVPPGAQGAWSVHPAQGPGHSVFAPPGGGKPVMAYPPPRPPAAGAVAFMNPSSGGVGGLERTGSAEFVSMSEHSGGMGAPMSTPTHLPVNNPSSGGVVESRQISPKASRGGPTLQLASTAREVPKPEPTPKLMEALTSEWTQMALEFEHRLIQHKQEIQSHKAQAEALSTGISRPQPEGGGSGAYFRPPMATDERGPGDAPPPPQYPFNTSPDRPAFGGGDSYASPNGYPRGYGSVSPVPFNAPPSQGQPQPPQEPVRPYQPPPAVGQGQDDPRKASGVSVHTEDIHAMLGLDDVQRTAVDAHNTRRRAGGAPDLRFDALCRERAQQKADDVVLGGKAPSRDTTLGGRMGQNVAQFDGFLEKEVALARALEQWLAAAEAPEHKQALAKAATHMGCGIATDRTKTVVVANYSPKVAT